MSLEAAVQADNRQLYGDLHSAPKSERRLVNQDVYALEWALPHAGAERPIMEALIKEYQDLLRAELLQSDRFLDAMLQHRLGPQFRSRPDFPREKIAIEQWLPAMDCWMVNGYFDRGTPYYHIIDTLEAGDPRKQTPKEHLEEQRAASAAQRGRNEQASTDKLRGVIDGLASKQVENFVAVEQALHSGDSIALRGDDRRKMETLEADTRKAAQYGDPEAQRVLTQGQRDTKMCVLPSTNPLRHRHRSERRKPKEA